MPAPEPYVVVSRAKLEGLKELRISWLLDVTLAALSLAIPTGANAIWAYCNNTEPRVDAEVLINGGISLLSLGVGLLAGLLTAKQESSFKRQYNGIMKGQRHILRGNELTPIAAEQSEEDAK